MRKREREREKKKRMRERGRGILKWVYCVPANELYNIHYTYYVVHHYIPRI